EVVAGFSGKVYKISNIVDGKAYVGITVCSLEKRWREHRCAARMGNDLPLYRAIRRHGEAAFTIEVIATAKSFAELYSLERDLIATHASHCSSGRGYNCTLGGEGVDGIERLGGEDVYNARLTDEIVRFLRDPNFSDITNDEMKFTLAGRFGTTVSRDCIR